MLSAVSKTYKNKWLFTEISRMESAQNSLTMYWKLSHLKFKHVDRGTEEWDTKSSRQRAGHRIPFFNDLVEINYRIQSNQLLLIEKEFNSSMGNKTRKPHSSRAWKAHGHKNLEQSSKLEQSNLLLQLQSYEKIIERKPCWAQLWEWDVYESISRISS